MKALLKIIVGLILVVLLAVTAIFIFIDPNDYKQEIKTVVKDTTGRDLIINGDMKLSLFPWVGVSINKVGLSAAKGFGSDNMLTMEKMDVRLKITPLLKQEIHVAKIMLDGLSVNLQVNQKGVSSWADLTQAAPQKNTSIKESKQTTATATTDKNSNQTTAIPKLVLGGVEFTNANVSYVDKKAGTNIQLKNFNLIIGQFELGKPFEMEMDFAIKNAEPAVDAKITFGGLYTVDLKNQQYTIKGMFLTVDAYGKVVPAGHQKIALNANAKIDLKQDIINLQKMTLKAVNVVLNGQAQIQQATQAPNINANLKIDSFSLRETMKALKMALPEMADDTTLTAISAKLAIQTDLKDIQLNDINLQLDQTHLTGTVLVNNLAKPAVRYNLALSEIDVDRYLPPKKEQPKQTEATTETAQQAKDTPIVLPVEMMRELDIKGHFTAKGFKVMNLKTQQTDIGLLAKKGVITVLPLTMNMYQGKMDGKVIVDVTGKKPIYRFATKLNGVEVEPLMTDFMELDKVQGKTIANINVHTTGESVNQLKAALNGKLNMAFKDGAIKGFNLEKELKKAEAAINGSKFDDTKSYPKTDFSDVTMSAIITNGVIKNEDFSLRAPFLRVGGAGKVDLVKNELDYLVKALLTDKQEAQSGKEESEIDELKIPVRISGKFSDIQINVLLAEALAERASQQYNEAIAKEKVKLKAQKDKLKAELKAKEDKLNAELKAKEATEKAKLAAEAKAKEDKLKAELKAKQDAEKKRLENELKNKLKGLF